jgi:hypothetical protein
MRIEGDLASFDEQGFIDSMADILEIDSRLIEITGTSSGSVIVDFKIYDANGVDSAAVADNLVDLIETNDPSLSEAGITVLSYSIDTTTAGSQQGGDSSSGLSTGGVVAIAVIVPIAAIALVGIAFFAYKKKNEGGSAGKNTVEMRNVDKTKKKTDEETGTATSTSESDSDEDSSDETSDSEESSETGSESETGTSSSSGTGTSETGSESESESESGTSASSSE